mgnify:CR=1 FL=1
MSKPCDRIEILSGQYVPRCDCGNSGDLMMATMWCAEKNDAPIKDALERENARLREEVEMLNVRHAAAMLHAQTHADEYNALREELAIQSNANVGLMEELAEAKREREEAVTKMQQGWLEVTESGINHYKQVAEQAEARALEYKTEHAALLGTSQWQETEIADLRDDVKRHMQIASECEERALANEKDAGRYRLLRSRIEVPGAAAKFLALNNWHPSTDLHDLDAAIDAAIAGAKHEA